MVMMLSSQEMTLLKLNLWFHNLNMLLLSRIWETCPFFLEYRLLLQLPVYIFLKRSMQMICWLKPLFISLSIFLFQWPVTQTCQPMWVLLRIILNCREALWGPYSTYRVLGQIYLALWIVFVGLCKLHWTLIGRLLKEFYGILHRTMVITKSLHLDLVDYCNADWASNPNDRRSTIGYCIYLGSNMVSWSAKKHVVSRSSMEQNT